MSITYNKKNFQRKNLKQLIHKNDIYSECEIETLSLADKVKIIFIFFILNSTLKASIDLIIETN